MPAESNIVSRNTLAIISFVFGLLAILSAVILTNNIITGLFRLAAMIIGAVALKQIKKRGGKGKGLAIEGIVAGDSADRILYIGGCLLFILYIILPGHQRVTGSE